MKYLIGNEMKNITESRREAGRYLKGERLSHSRKR